MSDATAAPNPGTRLERCPNCDAKLPATPVSICPYCVFPLLDQGDPSPEGESPNAERIRQVQSKEAFAEALAWTPPEGPQYQRGQRQVLRGMVFLAPVIPLTILGYVLAEGSYLRHPLTIVGLVLLVVGLAFVFLGQATRGRATTGKLLKRAGVILERRSEVTLHGWSGTTVYFFSIEFEDGAVAEFRFPGRGAHEEPYTPGLAGVAYTRGEELLNFRLVRI